MALSKKHYETFAERFQQQLTELRAGRNDNGQAEYGYDALRGLAAKLSLTFKQDNPRFDAIRFLKACGF
jgi:hypothetical protein